MPALILAAGLGTRLRPWTNKIPKPLIPVAGIEPLFFAITKIREAGIKRIFINCHHLPDQIETAVDGFRKVFSDLDLEISYEPQVLGTGGAILKLMAEDKIDSGLLVLNGDTLNHFDLSRLIARSSFAMSLDSGFLLRYKPVFLDATRSWQPAQQPGFNTAAHFLGAHFLSDAHVRILQAQNVAPHEVDLFQGIYQPLWERGEKIVGEEYKLASDEFWVDLNKKEFFTEARALVLSNFSALWTKLLAQRRPDLPPAAASEVWPFPGET